MHPLIKLLNAYSLNRGTTCASLTCKRGTHSVAGLGPLSKCKAALIMEYRTQLLSSATTKVRRGNKNEN